MPRRPLILPLAVLLVACLAVLPACKKNKPDTGGGGVEPAPDGVPPAGVSNDYVLFARLNAKDILDSGVFIMGLSLLEAMPLLVEVSVLLDLFVAIFVMGIIVHHISREFSSLDTTKLSFLKE